MRIKIGIFGVLLTGLVLVCPLASVATGAIYAPEGAKSVPDEIIDKINQYVIDQSGISTDYFNTHCEVTDAYRTGGGAPPPYRCNGKHEGEYILDCNENTYMAYVLWKFILGDYTAIVCDHNERFGFVIDNGEVREHFRYGGAGELRNRPFPKFREITTVAISKSQFDKIVNNCADFTEGYADPLRLTPKTFDSDTLSLFYKNLGKKDGKDMALTIDLETGEYSCKETMVFREGEEVVTTKVDNLKFYLAIGIVMLVLIVLAVILLLKFKKK